MKKILLFLVIALIIGGGFYAYKNYSNFSDIFSSKPLTIDNTANVVDEIKKIGEFTTACYFEEMVLQDSYTTRSQIMGQNTDQLLGKALGAVGLSSLSAKADKAAASVANTKNEIVLIGKGQVRAGFNLSKLKESDLVIHGDTLDITLPSTEVFDIIMNPSDFTTEYEKGTWNHELTKPVKARAKVMLEQNAIENGILTKAEENGKKQLEALFSAFGFKQVNIAVSPQTETHDTKTIG